MFVWGKGQSEAAANYRGLCGPTLLVTVPVCISKVTVINMHERTNDNDALLRIRSKNNNIFLFLSEHLLFHIR